MAAVDLTRYLRNNMKREVASVVGSIQDPLPAGAGGDALVSADVYTVAVVPPNSLITSVSVVVETAATGTTATADVSVNSTVVINDVSLKTAAVTGATLAAPIHTGASSALIKFTPTLTSASGGAFKVFVTYVDAASTLTYTEEQ